MSAPEEMTLKVIAHIRTAFPTKFGIPRQSGLVDSLRGEVIFTPEYRNADAVRGLEDFSHIWLVWQFSGAVRDSWSPTVRPPRLGGNTRVGVFATRSPFRPNPLGLSSVRLEGIEYRPQQGPVLLVRGADLMDGTPIYDIKPYIVSGSFILKCRISKSCNNKHNFSPSISFIILQEPFPFVTEKLNE